MTRWAAGVEYQGTAYAGWQSLPGRTTVQAVLEAALSRVADHPVHITAAGRTDAGVHALQQVIHFDSDAARSPYAWTLGTNANLPPDINLRWVQVMPLQFHARYKALARSYRYVIHNHSARSALLHERAAWWPQRLDSDAMHRAAQCLLGEQDFSAFRDSQCQSPTAMRNLHRIVLFRRGDCVVMDIRGNAFLHHMVRNIIGTLAEVGLGKRPEAWVAEVLAARQRVRAGMTAPACGLYFTGPEYPAEFAVSLPPTLFFPA